MVMISTRSAPMETGIPGLLPKAPARDIPSPARRMSPWVTDLLLPVRRRRAWAWPESARFRTPLKPPPALRRIM